MPRIKRSKNKKQLINKLFVLKNPDKAFHEKWTQSRNMLNIPHPFQCLLLGRPNCGKTSTVKNILIRQNPPFERMVVVHCSPDYTKEYDDCDAQIVEEIPPREDFDCGKKTLVVLEDIDFKNLSKEQKHRLNRMYGNWSTHNSISIISTSQDFFELDPIVRRCTNLWVLWPGIDLNEMSQIARKVGLNTNKLTTLFNLCKTKHDSIWIDQTKGSPHHLRFNGFTNLT